MTRGLGGAAGPVERQFGGEAEIVDHPAATRS
jgi:hypothetical protein